MGKKYSFNELTGDYEEIWMRSTRLLARKYARISLELPNCRPTLGQDRDCYVPVPAPGMRYHQFQRCTSLEVCYCSKRFQSQELFNFVGATQTALHVDQCTY